LTEENRSVKLPAASGAHSTLGAAFHGEAAAATTPIDEAFGSDTTIS
jgi:hypothetical protein